MRGIGRYLARFDDGEVMRWCFRGLLAGALIVIALDAKALHDAQPKLDPMPTGAPLYLEPALPPALRPMGPATQTNRPNFTVDPEMLRKPLTMELQGNGVLDMTGSIDIGSAKRFAEEIEKRGEYVKLISLNSPGGSLDDAMAIARLAREKGLATRVADDAICASSCPLIFAGGVERSAGTNAAIGLHQFYSATDVSSTNPAQAMSDAQATAARINRYLSEMGVDPALWLHALDTPPQTLYYLSADELKKYKLVNGKTEAAIDTPSVHRL